MLQNIQLFTENVR